MDLEARKIYLVLNNCLFSKPKTFRECSELVAMWFLRQVTVAKFIVAFSLLLPPLIPCHSTWAFFACCLLKMPSLSSYAMIRSWLPSPPASNQPHPTWSPIETRFQGLGYHFMLMGITSSQILGFDSAWSVMGWGPGKLRRCWVAIEAEIIHTSQTMHPSWSQDMREITHSCYEQWPTKEKPLLRIPSSLYDLCRHFVFLSIWGSPMLKGICEGILMGYQRRTLS